MKSVEYAMVAKAISEAWNTREELSNSEEEQKAVNAAIVMVAVYIGQGLSRASQEYDLNEFLRDCGIQ